MKTVKELIEELEQIPQDAFVLIGEDSEPKIECGDFPQIFSGYTEYNEYCRIVVND